MAESKHDKQNGSSGDEPEQFRKLFIGGLSLNTTDDGLREYYGKYGNIVDCVVMRDGATKKSRGFGFVTYSAKSEVDTAMSSRPHTIDGKTVDPKRAVPRDQSSRGEANVSTQRLYVSGVREDHSEEQFREYFSDFGTVTKVEIISDKQTNKPRGFGFVTFDDYDSVDKCVLIKSHTIGGHRCDVKKALSRDEMARAQQMDRDRAERGSRSRGPGRGQATVAWQGPASARGPGPAGGFREPHGYGAAAPAWGAQAWSGAPQAQWGGGYPAAAPYGQGQQQWGGAGGDGQWSQGAWGSGGSYGGGQWNQAGSAAQAQGQWKGRY